MADNDQDKAGTIDCHVDILVRFPIAADDERTEEEAAKRRDQIAKRMLNTPPKPHKDSIKGSRGTTKKGGGHKDRRQSRDDLA